MIERPKLSSVSRSLAGAGHKLSLDLCGHKYLRYGGGDQEVLSCPLVIFGCSRIKHIYYDTNAEQEVCVWSYSEKNLRAGAHNIGA